MRTVPLAVAALATVCLATGRAAGPPEPQASQGGAPLGPFEVALPPDCEVNSMALAPDGRIVVVGSANSDAFPTTPGAIQAQCDRSQYGYCLSPFVMVYSAGGDLLYSTFAGGASQRWLHSAAFAPDGGIWLLLGTTYRSPDPVFDGCSAHQPVLARIRPGFPGYERIVCVGGPNAHALHPVGMAIASDGSIWVAGQAERDSALQTVNAWQPTPAGSTDVFAIRYGAGTQETLLATYLGGSEAEYPNAVAVAPDGDLVIAGGTQSYDFPAVRPFQARHGGTRPYVSDAFTTRLDAGGRLLEYSTYLGGAECDDARGLWVDAAGNAYVVGNTGSPDFPVTAGAAGKEMWPGPYSGFLASVDAAGSLRFSTRLAEQPLLVMAREDGPIAVAGETWRLDFPRVGRVSHLWPTMGFGRFPYFVQTDPVASELSRSTLVPVATGLYPRVDTPSPVLGLENAIKAAAFDAGHLYLAGKTGVWYRPSPTSDMLWAGTGHYLKKWNIEDAADAVRRNDRR